MFVTRPPDPLVIRAMQQKLDELQQQSGPAREKAQQAELAAALARQQSNEIESMIVALEDFLGQARQPCEVTT